MSDQLLETWEIHNRINLYLLEAVAPEAFAARAALRGRTVGEQFAHLHHVRMMWLNAAAPDLSAAVEKIDVKGPLGPEILSGSLIESGAAITQLLGRAAKDGKIKGFKPSITAFLGYFISHESHHRGQIVLTLKLAGHPVDKKVLFGLWEWGTR